MRIVDAETRKTLSSIWLFLTRSEAAQLRGFLEQLLAGDIHDHFHMDADDYEKRIMIQGYDPADVDKLTNEKVAHLFRYDEWPEEWAGRRECRQSAGGVLRGELRRRPKKAGISMRRPGLRLVS